MSTKILNLESPGNVQDILTVQEVLAGNKKAFEKIYNKYFKHIFRSLSVKLNYNNATAEDLAMETMAKVYVNLNKFEPNGTFNSWITQISKNTLVDYIRSESKHNNNDSFDTVFSSNNSDEFVSKAKHSLIGTSLNPEEVLIKEEKNKTLYKTINTIKDVKTRQCVVLIYLKDMTYEQVAVKTGLPIGSVKGYTLRGKKFLGDKLIGRI